VYGAYNKKTDFKPKVIPKRNETVNRIKTRLTQAFMFSSLDENEQKIVIDAMEEKKF
jgi:cAMP-dependent protein kinase regulator